MHGRLQDRHITVNDTKYYKYVKDEKSMNGKSYYKYFKRLLDVVLSLVALVVLLPVFLIVAIAIKLEDGGNVFYSQIRCGKDNKLFRMYKFRSMCVNADEKLKDLVELNERDGPAFKISNDPRITKVGAFIRKTCIDELPQLINILKGEMSIVGPRPPLQEEVKKYTDYDMQRLLVTPGLTCYWQVKKGSNTTFEEWVEMDLQYIRNQSFVTDCKLIVLTLKVILFGKGDK